MIQRIQSLYLLLSGALMFAMYNFSLATYFNSEGVWEFYAEGIKTVNGNTVISISTWPVAIIIALSGLISFITIFGFKNRKRQAKGCVLSGMFMLLFYPVALIYWWYGKETLAATSTSWGPVLVFPLMAFILNIMAVRSINGDERLVRSADRIR